MISEATSLDQWKAEKHLIVLVLLKTEIENNGLLFSSKIIYYQRTIEIYRAYEMFKKQTYQIL